MSFFGHPCWCDPSPIPLSPNPRRDGSWLVCQRYLQWAHLVLRRTPRIARRSRSISSGDSLTAIVVGWSPTTSPSARTKQSRRLGAGGEGESGGATSARGRAPQRQHHRHDGSPRSREGSRRSPLRLEFIDNEGRGGDIDQLRDDVARRLYKERLLAGRGAAAASSPTRPIGSPVITPVTGGGRGASPEHSRPTSPRSASPRGAAKGPGRSSPRGSVRDGGGGGSRPGSPTRSVCSGACGCSVCGYLLCLCCTD